MANNVVKFYQTTFAKYSAALTNNNIDSDALYFVINETTNKTQIYKGSVLYAADFTGDINDILTGDIATITGQISTLQTVDNFLSGQIDTKAASTDVTSADTFLSGAIVDGDQYLSAAIGQIQTSAITISGSNVIEVTGTGKDKGIDLKLASNHILSKTATGLSAAVTLKPLETTTSGFASSYGLFGIDGTQLGATINIPKDQLLKNAEFIKDASNADVLAASAAGQTITAGEAYLKFTFSILTRDDSTGAETYSDRVVYVSVEDLVDTYIAGNGIAERSTANGIEFYLSGDTNDDTKFLQIGTNTIGLNGITEAITGAVNGEAVLRASADTYLSGQIDAINSSTGSKDADTFLSGAIESGDAFLSGAIERGEAYISGIVGDNKSASESADSYISGVIGINKSDSESGDAFLSGAIKSGDAFLSGAIERGEAYISGIVGNNKSTLESADGYLSAQIGEIQTAASSHVKYHWTYDEDDLAGFNGLTNVIATVNPSTQTIDFVQAKVGTGTFVLDMNGELDSVSYDNDINYIVATEEGVVNYVTTYETTPRTNADSYLSAAISLVQTSAISISGSNVIEVTGTGKDKSIYKRYSKRF